MKTIISGNDIIKSYGEGSEKRNALDGVSLEIKEGEFIAVMGPSGSGKSTLLFALSGMDKIDQGNVKFAEKELASLREKELADIRRRGMGFVFQQATMLKNLNILDNIILPAMRDNRKKAAHLIDKAKSYMEKTGIEELASRDISQVSGGQLQRAGICRALMNDPQILFGDEPTGALNSRSAHEVMDILSEINRNGTAILLVTHDARIAARASRILFMGDGRVIDEVQLSPYHDSELEQRTNFITEKTLKIGI